MSYEEKRTWIMAVVTVAAYAAYLAIVLGRADSTPLTEVSYASTLLWTIGAAIVAAIVLNIAVAAASPEGADKKDQRDREISRFGEYIGQSFVVIGAVAALVMSVAELDYFWIANAIYLAFVLSSVLSCVAKLVAYRRGFQPW
ncbi:hypothetical protein [Streptomyces sp. NPDC020681]|uniref:hypothetical protein n=1 Tax=Streptomyces sp. NPDC020681 TaxID=3365083 RepID=UPI00378F542D